MYSDNTPEPKAPVDTVLPEKVCAICGEAIEGEAGFIATVHDVVGDNTNARTEWHCFRCDPITADEITPDPVPAQNPYDGG